MPVSAAFLDMVREFLSPLGAISTRRMFGGAGIYCGGVMFALVEDDVLYFKADDASKARYISEGLKPFAFEGQTRMVETSYWRAPERVFDEPDDILDFARDALRAARQIKDAKGIKKTKPAAAAATAKAPRATAVKSKPAKAKSRSRK